MPEREATARIKINKLLEAAGWRFSPDGDGPANIRLEPRAAIKPADLDSLGENFEKAERRLLLDTYRTFGCESGQPTFRYSLLDGVKDGYLVNPTVVDARTEITTELLSDEGFIATFTDDTGEDQQETFKQREFEKRFFSEATNQLFCKTFLENALRDPGWRCPAPEDRLQAPGFLRQLRVLRDRVQLRRGAQATTPRQLLRDVVERHGVSNITGLHRLVRHLLGNAGSPFSVEKFHRTLKSQGMAISRDTVHQLLAYIEDCFLVRTVWMESESERQFKNLHKAQAAAEALRYKGEDRATAKKPLAEWDVTTLLKLMWEAWNDVFGRTLGCAKRSLVQELRDWRNKWGLRRVSPSIFPSSLFASR